jgi:lipopolysaccharide transport system ATP-binding protein
MPDVAVEVNRVSKRFHRGEFHDSLRDLIPAFTKRVLGRGPRRDELGKGDFWALNGVSFQVKRGEALGIIGANGAGKSTLLKILSKILKPTRGSIRVSGRLRALIEVAAGFHGDLTGRENVYLNGSILGMKKREIDAKFDEIVEFSGIGPFLDTPVKRYSSGMHARLGFAVAAHLDPEILIVDEVLAVGDADFQKKCIGKMSDVAAGGRTVLFVSHNLSAVEQLCGRVILLDRGAVAFEGPAVDVLPHYLRGALGNFGGEVDLTNHTARAAKFRPIIVSMRLTDDDHQLRSIFFPDEGLTVELLLRPDREIREPRIAVAIEDGSGRRIGTAASYFQSSGLGAVTAPTSVRCRLPRLNLGSGRYMVSVSIADKYSGMLDSIDGAAWFSIAWRDNYGNGEPYLPVYGPVLMPSTWERGRCVERVERAPGIPSLP